jgi:hypothetical protein
MSRFAFMALILMQLIACGRYRVKSSTASSVGPAMSTGLIDSAIEWPLYDLLMAQEISDAEGRELRKLIHSEFDSGTTLISHLDERELGETVMRLLSKHYLSTCHVSLKCSRSAGHISAEALLRWYQSTVGMAAVGTQQIEALRIGLYSQLPKTMTDRTLLPSH